MSKTPTNKLSDIAINVDDARQAANQYVYDRAKVHRSKAIDRRHYEGLTAQDLASMDMETYKKYRDNLVNNNPPVQPTSDIDSTKVNPSDYYTTNTTTTEFDLYSSRSIQFPTASEAESLRNRIKELEEKLDEMSSKVEWLMEAFEEE